MGTVISQASKARIGAMVNDASKQGAKVLCGGCEVDYIAAPNAYYPPTIIEVDPSMTIWREEVLIRGSLQEFLTCESDSVSATVLMCRCLDQW
jgi:hypothetical protein